MAAGVISKPGTKYGPCADECQHRDCSSLRYTAASTCRICQKPIDYEVAFYGEWQGYVHAVCLEAENET